MMRARGCNTRRGCLCGGLELQLAESVDAFGPLSAKEKNVRRTLVLFTFPKPAFVTSDNLNC